MTAERCPRCDRPRDAQDCADWGDIACGINCHPVDWRARALAAEASAASWERLHDRACQNVAHAHQEGESVREYACWSSRRHQAMADIARRALVEGLAECDTLRDHLAMARAHDGAASPEEEQVIRTDATRAERSRTIVDEDKEASTAAFDEIAAACGCPEWDYPGQVVRDVLGVIKDRDAARAEVERLQGVVGEVIAERDEARKNYQFMVERAADQKLDGYRELGARAAAAEDRVDAALREVATLRAALGEADAAISQITPGVSRHQVATALYDVQARLRAIASGKAGA